MPKVAVTLFVESSVIVTVDAKGLSSNSAAVEKARELVGHPPELCPHCRAKIEVGDFTGESIVEMVQ